MNIFAIKIKELRTENNLSQADLAKVLNYTQSNICEWEKGTVEPKATALQNIANYFNVSIDYLLGRTDELGALLVSSTNFQTTPKEQQMITSYRKLPAQSQEYVYGIIQNLAAHS